MTELTLQQKKKLRREKVKNFNLAREAILYSEENLASIKTCSSCKFSFSRISFNREIHSKDGFSGKCKICLNSYQRNRYEKNGEIYEKRKEYIKRKPEIVKKISHNYYWANRDKVLEKKKLWSSKNTARVTAYARKREQEKRNTIPPWADLKEIEKFYLKAAAKFIETGVKHSVDHIIPLKGKLVCGLHVETNLRVIPHKENLIKHNKFSEGLLNV